MWRFTCVAVFILCAFSGRTAPAEQKILPDFPEYPNYYGCAPTSGAMILGYWDSNGYPDLLPGRATPFRDEIKELIASSRHIADYWVAWNSTAEDPWVTEGRPAPTTADCLADYMVTSRGLTPDGWASPAQITGGLQYFASYRNASYEFTGIRHFSLDFEEDFIPEIDAGRPVLLFVKIGSSIDHVLVGYGYDDSDPDNPKFAAMDTFMGNPPGTIDWWPWSKTAGGVIVKPLSPPLPYPTGDADEDGCVNVLDLLVVRANLGKTGSQINPPSADVDSDGTVNIADLLAVRAALGQGSGCL